MGIMEFFCGGGNNKQKIENENIHTEQSPVTQAMVTECSGCGAKNMIYNDSECEYCGTPLAYIGDGKTVSVKGASVNADRFNTTKEYTLTTGFYTAGIDIPTGICNVKAVSGSGNLMDSGVEINEIFGVEKGDVSSFKGLKLSEAVSLKVAGKLTIKISYRLINDGCSGRNYDMASAIELSTGYYKAGLDFKAGVYTIVAVSGTGNLSTDDVGVNEMFGLEEEDVHEYKNVNLYIDSELSIEGNLTVRLIPAIK